MQMNELCLIFYQLSKGLSNAEIEAGLTDENVVWNCDSAIGRRSERTIFADPENDYLHLDHHVTYADVIIVCFHDTMYQLQSFEL